MRPYVAWVRAWTEAFREHPNESDARRVYFIGYLSAMLGVDYGAAEAEAEAIVRAEQENPSCPACGEFQCPGGVACPASRRDKGVAPTLCPDDGQVVPMDDECPVCGWRADEVVAPTCTCIGRIGMLDCPVHGASIAALRDRDDDVWPLDEISKRRAEAERRREQDGGAP